MGFLLMVNVTIHGLHTDPSWDCFLLLNLQMIVFMDDSWNPFFSFCWTISFPSHLTCIPHHATSPDDCWYHYVGISVVGLNPHLSFHGFAHSRWLHFRPKKNQINRVHSLHQSQSSCLLVTPSFDSRNSTTTGWWLGHPSEKYEFVNWDD